MPSGQHHIHQGTLGKHRICIFILKQSGVRKNKVGSDENGTYLTFFGRPYMMISSRLLCRGFIIGV
jgi:hypothetical protein